ncbi:MAG: O-unit flippase-like protein [Draconibacterium sp.]
MQIGRKDIAWNAAGTFMRVASGVIILPIVLRTFPKAEYGLWTIFIYVGTIAALLDFGFSNAFGRNITYIFSGVKELKKKGYVTVPQNDKSIDFGLLKSVIVAMKKYYAALAGIFLLLFGVASPFYLPYILQKNNYQGDHKAVWIAWLIYGVLVAYQLYTYYYSSLLTGRGLIKRNQQAIIIGQAVRILVIYVLILMNFGLIALVIGQFLGDFITRTISRLFFYDKNIRKELAGANTVNTKEILSIMFPNAARIGITTLGGLLITRAAVPIASLYLPLETIGSFGVTKMMIDLIVSIGGIWFFTFYPKITSYRVNNEFDHLKRMYIKGKFSLILAFVICGTGLVLFGNEVLDFINSKTELLPVPMIIVMLIVYFFESNHALSAQMLLTKNEVPFAKASIISGVATIIMLFLGLKYTHFGVWIMFLAPGIAQIVYNNWKWPLLTAQDLKLRPKDFFLVIKNFWKENKYIIIK